jgi:acetyl esterase/lipase
MVNFFDTCYFRTSPDPDADRRKPYASPIFADVSTFPGKILVVSCEYDGVRVSNEEFRAKLLTEGGGKIDVRGGIVEGVAHGWDGRVTKEGAPGWKERVEMYDEVAKLVRDVAAN